MKKAISLLLVFLLCLSMCACGVDIEEAVVGTWEYERVGSDYAGGTCVWTDVLTLYKGGTGRYQQLQDGKPGGGNASATWEIKDGVLNITISAWTRIDAYTYDSDNDTLTKMDNTTVFIRKAA